MCPAGSSFCRVLSCVDIYMLLYQMVLNTCHFSRSSNSLQSLSCSCYPHICCATVDMIFELPFRGACRATKVRRRQRDYVSCVDLTFVCSVKQSKHCGCSSQHPRVKTPGNRCCCTLAPICFSAATHYAGPFSVWWLLSDYMKHLLCATLAKTMRRIEVTMLPRVLGFELL